MPVPEDATPTQAETIDSAGSPPPTPRPAPVRPPAAPLFGRYRPLRELGRGGMGIVLRAHDEVLGIEVALKMVPDQVLRDTEGIADLKKEVLRGMALTHPGIVRVYSFEQDQNGAAIVMECVEGETLAALKLHQPGRCFEPAELLPWVRQLCAALDYAHHEARIAHRDLKPANILLKEGRQLKIADFGIASSLADTLTRISVRSDSSGTPAYMSPQQAMGERPSHLDDIYSLGATLYELLTGKPPFFRGNILAQTLQEKPCPMALRRAELGIAGRPPIPPAWETLVSACLEKEPGKRPANGAAVLKLLSEPPPAGGKERAPQVLIPIKPVPAVLKTGSAVPREVLPAAGAPIVVSRPPAPVERFRWNRRRVADWSPVFDWLKTFLLVTAAAALAAGGLRQLRRQGGAPGPLPSAESKGAAATPSVSRLNQKANEGRLDPQRDLIPSDRAAWEKKAEPGREPR